MANNVNKRNSLPSLTLNKFFVSKRTSMFECQEETPREKRERSPCGMLEVSEQKLQARKDTKKKVDAIAKRKRLADPYAEESTDMDADEQEIAQKSDVTERKITVNGIEETKTCPHTNKSVNKEKVRKTLKVEDTLGDCNQCRRAKSPLGLVAENGEKENYVPVIWLCAFCGNQGCDRNHHKHSFKHYNAPRSDDHFIAISTQSFIAWCYKCNTEVIPSSCKKLDELIQFLKSKSEMARSRRRNSNRLSPNKPYTNLTSQFSGSDSRLYLTVQREESLRMRRLSKISASHDDLPKPKGLANLGNTCFFNSVSQCLSQTHFLTQSFDLNLQDKTKVTLPGFCRPDSDTINYNYHDEFQEDQLRSLDIFLPEGEPLGKAFAKFLKDMHVTNNSSNVRPDQLFNAVCHKHPVYSRRDQQDAHELLRCFLDSIRNEEVHRRQAGILKAYNVSDRKKRNDLSEKFKAIIKSYGKQAYQTIVDDIFGGQLMSTVICEHCHSLSQIFEPFMDLSLPINEEKGKHRKGNGDDDGVMECFGRSPRQNGPSKYQQKKTKKQQKQQKKNAKGKRRMANKQFQMEEKNNRRLTEKRPADEMDVFDEIPVPSEKIEVQEIKTIKNTKVESEKFKKLSQAMSIERNDSDEEEESYDFGDDDDDDSFGSYKKTESESGNKAEVPEKVSEYAETTEASEYTAEDSAELLDEEIISHGRQSVMSDKSTASESSKETSDADVEDNTDSDFGRKSKRQPSIVVDESIENTLNGNYEPENQLDNRFLSSCQSLDFLNTASDTSEKYYTAAAGETMDELDINFNDVDAAADGRCSIESKSPSMGTINSSSGKGDSISISSGETLEDKDFAHCADQDQIDNLCFKTNELSIGNDSLLELSKSELKNSTETLPTFELGDDDDDSRNIDLIDDDDKTIDIEDVKKKWEGESLKTLAPRYESDREECSVMSCLSNFTAPELLTGYNKITCEKCTKLQSGYASDENEEKNEVKSSASKQLLLFSPPGVLTLHFKRFQQCGYNLRKINKFVQFPLVLDLAPFVSSVAQNLDNMNIGQKQVLYALYGIVEHSGNLSGGHYVSYVRTRPLEKTRIGKKFQSTKPSCLFQKEDLIAEAVDKFQYRKGPHKSNVDKKEIEDEVEQGRWYFISDSYVKEVNIDKVKKAQAYLLFYERVL